MLNLLKSTVFALLFATSLTACYRMPAEDEYSMIPATNNSDFTKERGNMTPGVGY